MLRRVTCPRSGHPSNLILKHDWDHPDPNSEKKNIVRSPTIVVSSDEEEKSSHPPFVIWIGKTIRQ